MVGIADRARREVDTAEADDDITLPRPGLVALTGLVPRALMPMSMVASSALSRTTPLMTRPDQPLATARPAITSPTRAQCSEPPPSMTSTPPELGSDRTDFNSALSWWQRTVVMTPANTGRAPY